MFKIIAKELKHHAPFTLMGAVAGVIFALVFSGISNKSAYSIFYILHPLHVVLSALVTASMYELHKRKPWKSWKGLISLFLIGYIG